MEDDSFRSIGSNWSNDVVGLSFLDRTNPVEMFAFAGPFLYAGILCLTYLAKWSGMVGPQSTVFHNHNMIAQSCVLLGLIGYTYWQTMEREGLPITAFLDICKLGAQYHRENVDATAPILYAFLVSKVFEWYDTVLLILNGKQPIALHMWHHATISVAFYTGYYTDAMIWIGGLNSFIHVIMYAYYAAIPGIKPFARYLTQLQIVQLFGGAAMNWIALKNMDGVRYQMFAKINMGICLSYGLLFLRFYVSKYKTKPSKKRVEKSASTRATTRAIVPKYVIIGDRKYDITNFNHPGGNVINYMVKGQDATEAYREFHNRSKRADTVLRSLPSELVERPTDDREMLDDFAKFRAQLVEEGFFKPDIPMLGYRVFEQTALFVTSVYVSQFSLLGAACIMGMFRARSGWIQHEGGHNSLTGIIWMDKLIQEIYLGFGLHSCGAMWNKMHNRHHATPQKSKYDMDLDTTPMVAFYDTAVESNRVKVFSKWWLKYQAYTFLPITSGIFIPLFWSFYLHPRKAIEDRNYRQMFFMLMSHIVSPILFHEVGGMGWGMAWGGHFMATWLSDMYLFGHFSLSHTFLDVVHHDDDISWVRYATEHSVDIAVGNPVVDWIMGYLNYQVIHHLFPSMPQHRGPEVSRRWAVFCEKHGLTYIRMGYFDAWCQMFGNLDRVGDVYQNKEVVDGKKVV
jgi:fatty acid desaturase 2 (delta-6 desaturase)